MNTRPLFVSPIWLVLVLALQLAACTERATYPIIDLDCGTLKLRFQEDFVGTFEISRWTEVPSFDKGSGWIALDADYSPMARTQLAIRPLPFSEKRPRMDRGRSEWTIFANPASVSRADYDAIYACLTKNIVEIDRAFLAARPGLQGGFLESEATRRPQLTAFAYGTKF